MRDEEIWSNRFQPGQLAVMRKILFTGIAVISLVACSRSVSPETSWSPTPAPASNPEVEALLPKGAFTVRGERTFPASGNGRASLEGFVDFGQAADGKDCEIDIVGTEMLESGPRKVRTIREAGGPEWVAEVTEDAYPDAEAWRDLNDIDAASVMMLFVPAMVGGDWSPGIVEGAGTGVICAIGVMPRFMDVVNGELVFDAERSAAAYAAMRDRWTAQLRIATGSTGSDYDEAFEPLNVMSQTQPFAFFTEGTQLRIEKTADGGFTLTQYRTDGEITLIYVFTPAEDRAVSAPAGAVTFFERIAERVKTEGLEQALEELDDED